MRHSRGVATGLGGDRVKREVGGMNPDFCLLGGHFPNGEDTGTAGHRELQIGGGARLRDPERQVSITFRHR